MVKMSGPNHSIPPRELETARAWVRNELELKQLPALPDDVEERLFLQGRSAWTFRYSDLKVEHLDGSIRIAFHVVATLKKEFHRFLARHRFMFSATSLYDADSDMLEVVEIHPLD
jgi:hypothetical protein